MCGSIQRTLKYEKGKDKQSKFYKVIAAPMLKYRSEKWALKRPERGKLKHQKFTFEAYLDIYLWTMYTI
jgi:hypothetical protein